MNGTIALEGKLFGLLQQIQEGTMINLIGPMRVARKDDVDLVLTVTDDEDARVDLSAPGTTITVTVAKDLGGAPTFTKAIGNGITPRAQTGDTLGQADIAIASADLTQAPGLYWIEVVVVFGGKRKTLIEAREFTIAESVAA